MYKTYDHPIRGEEATYRAIKNDPQLAEDLVKGDMHALTHLLGLSVGPAAVTQQMVPV